MVAQNVATLPASFGKSGFGVSPTGAAGSGVVATDTITELTASSGVTIDKSITPSAGIRVLTGSLTAGAFCLHSGGVGVTAVATGTDSTAVNTETYIVEVFVPTTTTFTGVSILHLATSTGNVQFAIADATGAVVAASSTASTATVAAAAFQQVPFSTALTLQGPATYFVLMQNSGSNHYRSHLIGNFRANKKTGEVYGTFTNVTVPTAFNASLGPICDLYV